MLLLLPSVVFISLLLTGDTLGHICVGLVGRFRVRSRNTGLLYLNMFNLFSDILAFVRDVNIIFVTNPYPALSLFLCCSLAILAAISV